MRSGTTDLPNNPPGQPPGQGNDNWRYTFLLDYNVYKNLTLLLSVPYVYNRDYEQGLHFTTSGVGDLDLFAKYSVYRDQVFNARKELQGIAGIEFPTGSTNVQSDQGALLSATEQAGSGTTNLFLGGAWLWTFPRGSTYGDLIYKFYGTNASYKFGNVLTITEGVDYPLPLEPVKKLSLTTELTGQFVSRDTSDNTSAPGVLASGQVDASGSDTIFIAPGLRWRPHAYWTVGFAPQIPIYQNLRGMQLKTSVIYMLTISTRLGAPSVAGE